MLSDVVNSDIVVLKASFQGSWGSQGRRVGAWLGLKTKELQMSGEADARGSFGESCVRKYTGYRAYAWFSL